MAHPARTIRPLTAASNGGSRDSLIADAVSIDDFYHFLRQWLDSHGDTAQVIVADNSPPDLVEENVIVRFSRDEEHPPYGLIDDETG
ncbi:hypothetical protein ACWGQ5_31555 [Streptomyces sp. NPDC055722]